jgi:murein DD-endopeptidase MepM/ murein hydrolase activator NlpD
MASLGRRTAAWAVAGVALCATAATTSLTVFAHAPSSAGRSPGPVASRPLAALRLRLPDLPPPAAGSRPIPHRPAVAHAVGPARAPASVRGPRRLALVWPSRGVVTSRFGWRVHPIFRRPEFHTGLDIATRYGSPVVAARAGVVRFVGWKTGYGRIVILYNGGGIETLYSHLSAAMVGPGQRVAQGQIIGRVGSTGWSTGPHLFFEVRRNGVPLDPSRYLK